MALSAPILGLLLIEEFFSRSVIGLLGNCFFRKYTAKSLSKRKRSSYNIIDIMLNKARIVVAYCSCSGGEIVLRVYEIS